MSSIFLAEQTTRDGCKLAYGVVKSGNFTHLETIDYAYDDRDRPETSNGAIIKAATHAVQWDVVNKKYGNTTIYTKSQYLVDCMTKNDRVARWITNGWKKGNGDPVANQQLLQELHTACTGRFVKFLYAHKGTDFIQILENVLRTNED